MCHVCDSLIKSWHVLFAGTVFERNCWFTHLDRDKFAYSAFVDESDGVSFSFFCLELKTICHIKFEIANNSIVVLIDENSHVFALPILRANVNILLLPISMNSCFYLLILWCFNNEVRHVRDGEGESLCVFSILESNAIPYTKLLWLDSCFLFYFIWEIQSTVSWANARDTNNTHIAISEGDLGDFIYLNPRNLRILILSKGNINVMPIPMLLIYHFNFLNK